VYPFPPDTRSYPAEFSLVDSVGKGEGEGGEGYTQGRSECQEGRDTHRVGASVRRAGIYIHIQLIHFTVPQKLSHIIKQLYSNFSTNNKIKT